MGVSALTRLTRTPRGVSDDARCFRGWSRGIRNASTHPLRAVLAVVGGPQGPTGPRSLFSRSPDGHPAAQEPSPLMPSLAWSWSLRTGEEGAPRCPGIQPGGRMCTLPSFHGRVTASECKACGVTRGHGPGGRTVRSVQGPPQKADVGGTFPRFSSLSTSANLLRQSHGHNVGRIRKWPKRRRRE